MRHADDGIVGCKRIHMAERDRVIAGSDRDLLSVGKFVIQGSSKIKALCLVSCCCTHKTGTSLKIVNPQRVYLIRRPDSHGDKFAVTHHLKEAGVFSPEINTDIVSSA